MLESIHSSRVDIEGDESGCQKVFIHPEDIEGDESAEQVGCQKVFIHPEDIEGDQSRLDVRKY